MNKILQVNKERLITINILIFVISLNSCKKLVETPPPSTSIAESNVFSTDGTAIGVLNGIYTRMNFSANENGIFQGNKSISLYTGLSADELSLYSGITGSNLLLYQNALTATNSAGTDLWSVLYNYVFRANAAIEGLTSAKADNLTLVIKQQLLGEAKFLRAFYYFYLMNLYGEVPLSLTTDANVNVLLSRSPITKVSDQVIDDLKQAQDLLSDHYLSGSLIAMSDERIRPTKWAAIALLARVYLYAGNYLKAEEMASSIINNSSLFGPLPALNSAFLKNSKEAIWQLQPTSINFNTMEAITLVLPVTGPNGTGNPVFLSNQLLSSFEPNDQRAVNGNWLNTRTVGTTTYRYAFKYKINSSPGVTDAGGMVEYFMMLRLGEQYLIRAEARARQGNLVGAIDDLDKIRGRANLPLIAIINPGISQTALLDKILHERQVELFCEWGHRWFDLRRTGNIDAVMNVVTPLKSVGSPWQSYQQYYPISVSELQKAPNLTQTTGY